MHTITAIIDNNTTYEIDLPAFDPNNDIIYKALKAQRFFMLVSGSGRSSKFSFGQISRALDFLNAHPEKNNLSKEIGFCKWCLDNMDPDIPITIRFA